MAVLGPYARPPRLAVAVSGGADSTALALLSQGWARAQGGDIMALIVDHGLRDSSANEASVTEARLRERGINSRILPLHGLPRAAGVQAAARHARHAALADAALHAGRLHLLLGHHADDQSETVAMRAARGPHGLEGIAAWSARSAVVLLRPLLGILRAMLRDYLASQRMGWIEDSSNHSDRFERVRIRQAGTGAQPSGPEPRQAREVEAARFLARHASMRPEGFAVLDTESAPAAALAALLRSLGGADYAPNRASVSALAAQFRPMTLGGVMMDHNARLGGWLLAREPAACAAPVPAMQGARWDGRFVLQAALAGHRFGALGPQASRFRGFNGLPSRVLRTLPCLRGPDGGVTFPAPARFAPPAPATCHPFLANNLC